MIHLDSPKALKQLMENGIVYTLRAKPRKQGVTSIIANGIKVGMANVRLVGVIDLAKPESLEPFLPYSGFGSVGEWVGEFRRLNGRVSRAFLYEVRLISH